MEVKGSQIWGIVHLSDIIVGMSLTLKDSENATASPATARRNQPSDNSPRCSHAAVPILPNPTARMTKQGLLSHLAAA